MKRSYTVLLKVLIVIFAIVALAGLIWFPQTEGRAAGLDLVSIYKDPLIIYAFVASIPFFVGLFQAFKLLSYLERTSLQNAVKTVRNIKYCALAFIGFLAVAIVYIRMFAQGDDPAGPTMLGFVAILASIGVATAAGYFQKRLGNT